MTPQQRVAQNYPCFEAEETAHTRFARRLHGLNASVILTLNVGME